MDEVSRFFSDYPSLLPLFSAVRDAIGATGPVALKVSRTQIAFVDGQQFAFVWLPQRVVKAPADQLVLGLGLGRRAVVPGVKSIAEAAPGRFTHHIPLATSGDVTPGICALIAEARDFARARARPSARVLPGSGRQDGASS